MYETTRKKYRKYNTKTLESEPSRTWSEKKVWKVLKLEQGTKLQYIAYLQQFNQ